MNKINNPFIGHKEYDCFGCSPDNPIGLKMEFTDNGEGISCEWEPNEHFQSYHHVLHGGIQATIMDEIASWFINAKLGTAGVTSRIETKHKKPVFTNKGKILIKAHLKDKNRKFARIHVDIFNNNGELSTTGLIEYFIFTPEVAKEKLLYPGKKAFYEPKP